MPYLLLLSCRYYKEVCLFFVTFVALVAFFSYISLTHFLFVCFLAVQNTKPLSCSNCIYQKLFLGPFVNIISWEVNRRVNEGSAFCSSHVMNIMTKTRHLFKAEKLKVVLDYVLLVIKLYWKQCSLPQNMSCYLWMWVNIWFAFIAYTVFLVLLSVV